MWSGAKARKSCRTWKIQRNQLSPLCQLQKSVSIQPRTDLSMFALPVYRYTGPSTARAGISYAKLAKPTAGRGAPWRSSQPSRSEARSDRTTAPRWGAAARLEPKLGVWNSQFGAKFSANMPAEDPVFILFLLLLSFSFLRATDYCYGWKLLES